MPTYKITSPAWIGGIYYPATERNANHVTVASADDAPSGGVLVPAVPVISNVVVVPSVTGATITWDTDIDADSSVAYRLAGAASFAKSAHTELDGTQSHTVTLADLDESAVYEFYPISFGTDEGGEATSAQDVFVTGSQLAITTVVATPDAGGTTCTITATITGGGATPVGTVVYGAVFSGASVGKASAAGAAVSIDLTGLTPETTYHFVVIARDTDSGAFVCSAEDTFTTLAA